MADDDSIDSLFEKPEFPGEGDNPGKSDSPEGNKVKWDSSTEKFDSEHHINQPTARAMQRPHRGLELQGQRTRLRLLEALDKGGMGLIWKAEKIAELPVTPIPSETPADSLPDLLAVKFVNPRAAEKFDPVVVIKRELAPLQTLKTDDHTVPIVDWSLNPRLPFLAFEFMALGSLDREIQATNGQGLSEEKLLNLAMSLLSAVATAHRCCVMHLDIKPQNVLLTTNGGYRLADFGIAMELMERNLQTLPGYGTRGYHAPEQAEYQVAMFNVQTDLFGVGMTLYAAATADSFEAILEHREAYKYQPFAMPSLEERRPDLRREFCSIIMSLLRNRRSARPGSPSEPRELIRAITYNDKPAVQAAEEFASRRVPETIAAEIVSRLVSSSWQTLLRERPHNGATLHYRDGETLITEGAHTYSAYVLLLGELEVTVKGTLINRITATGEIVGEVGAFTGTDRTATVRAIGDVYVLGFNAAEFENFVLVNPMVASRLFRSLCDRYVKARNEIADLRKQIH